MRKIAVLVLFTMGIGQFAFTQTDRVYTTTGGEIIFSFVDIEKEGEDLNNIVRFTLFLHLGNNVHFDINDYVGFFTGYGLRNIGFITENENDVKMKRRTYALGIPLGIKIGSFKDHFYVYGGGEYELFFHYKQKQFVDGNKSKYSEWFSDRTDLFAPSLFAGIQFPKGINLKFKYYPNDFLNRDFTGRDFGEEVDYSAFKKTNLFYVALSFNFRADKILDDFMPGSKSAKYASLIP